MTSLRAALKPAALRVSNFLSQAYVAGPDLGDGLRAVDRFAKLGYRSTLGYFNADTEYPNAIASLGVEALEGFKRSSRNGYVSLKAPAMKFDARLIGEIARAAKRTGVAIHFDSHGIEAADATFGALEVALKETRKVGCTLPARWSRSLQDVERATDLGLRVRVVKGQWADPGQPEVNLSQSYLTLVERLAGRVKAVGVATHDPILARAAVRRLRGSGTVTELELLFGLPMKGALAVAREEGVPVCIYVPFGNGWMPYAFSQLKRNPGIALWMVRDAMAVAALRPRG